MKMFIDLVMLANGVVGIIMGIVLRDWQAGTFFVLLAILFRRLSEEIKG